MPKVVNHRVVQRRQYLAGKVLDRSIDAMPACTRCSRAGLLCRVSVNSTRCVRCIQGGRSGCDISLDPVQCLQSLFSVSIVHR